MFSRFQETLERFAARLESVYTASGGKKINIISHSMGGLLVKCFMSLHSDVRNPHSLFLLFVIFFQFQAFGLRSSCLCILLLLLDAA